MELRGKKLLFKENSTLGTKTNRVIEAHLHYIFFANHFIIIIIIIIIVIIIIIIIIIIIHLSVILQFPIVFYDYL